MRRCQRCRQEKPSSEFASRGPRTCRVCVNERVRTYRSTWRRSAVGRATTKRNGASQRQKASWKIYMRRYRAVWAEKNSEKVAASRRLYKASAKGRETEAAYKARLRGAESRGHVDPKLWGLLVEAYSGACAYCRVAPAETRDHVVPLSRGGIHAIENLVPACRPCNSRKHTKKVAPKIPLLLRALSHHLYAGLVRTVYGHRAA